MTQIDRRAQRVVEPYEYWKLKHHGETPPQGIYLVTLVEIHDLSIHFLLVVFKSIPDTLHLRLQFLHLLHGDETLVCQGSEEEFDYDGKQNDINAIVAGKAVEKSQNVKQRRGDEGKVTEINGAVQTIAEGLQYIKVLGTQEQGESGRLEGTG